MSTATTSTINLLLLDDHVMFREGLARAIEKEPGFTVTGQASSTVEALEILASSATSIVLLDVDLGAERAIDFIVAARRSGFQGQFLIVTAGASDPEAIQLVQAGVSGILHKHNSTEVLFQTIRQIAAGDVSIEKTYLAPLFRSMDRTHLPGRPKLTERDKTVLRLILQGLTNREIAARLEISEGAVKASLRLVCEKLGVRTRAQLVRIALEQYRDQL